MGIHHLEPYSCMGLVLKHISYTWAQHYQELLYFEVYVIIDSSQHTCGCLSKYLLTNLHDFLTIYISVSILSRVVVWTESEFLGCFFPTSIISWFQDLNLWKMSFGCLYYNGYVIDANETKKAVDRVQAKKTRARNSGSNRLLLFSFMFVKCDCVPESGLLFS